MAAVIDPPIVNEQKVILNNVSWETYERLLGEHSETSGTRFSYDHGALEIIILSLQHEKFKHRLALLVEVLAEVLEIDVEGGGSTTFRRRDLARGFEPDACFYFTQIALIRTKDTIDLTVDPPPDLVIEIDITHPSLDKQPIMASLGIPEVWRYDGRELTLLGRRGDHYEPIQESAFLPGVTAAKLAHWCEQAQQLNRGDWLKRVRAEYRL